MSDNIDRLSFAEACNELQISEEELEKLVADGEISSIKEGDTLFFKPEAIAQFKKNKKTEPTIILNDDELDLLDGVEEISLDDLDLSDEVEVAAEDTTPAAEEELSIESIGDDILSDELEIPAESVDPGDAEGTAEVEEELVEDLDLAELSLDETEPATVEAGDELDITMEDDLSLDGLEEPELAGASDTSSDTVLNLDGLLDDEEISESTTPVPGTELGDLELSDTSDDITMEGTVTDEDTILDTDVLDLSDDDEFQLEGTAEGDVGAGDPTASTLLRGGGARVMQMKRVKGHPIMTSVLLLTGVMLLVPLAVLTNIYFFDNVDSPISNKAWILDSNVMKGAIESISDTLFGLIK